MQHEDSVRFSKASLTLVDMSYLDYTTLVQIKYLSFTLKLFSIFSLQAYHIV